MQEAAVLSSRWSLVANYGSMVHYKYTALSFYFGHIVLYFLICNILQCTFYVNKNQTKLCKVFILLIKKQIAIKKIKTILIFFVCGAPCTMAVCIWHVQVFFLVCGLNLRIYKVTMLPHIIFLLEFDHVLC